MRAYELDDFDNLETEGLLTGSRERGWLWFGLIVSLGLHLALCTYFYRTRFQTADAMLSEALPPPTFTVTSVDLAQLLDKGSVNQTNPAAKPEPDQTDVHLLHEKKPCDKLFQHIQACK